MKAVNVDEVLKILYRYSEFIFVTDYPKYREMQDKIANLTKVTDNADAVLGKIRVEIENHCGLLKENHCKYCSHCNCVIGVREILEIFDKYKGSEVVE